MRKAFPWLVTKGRIVSSKTESYVASTGGQSHSGARYFHALIEFAYTVDGQEYHNTVGEPGGAGLEIYLEFFAAPSNHYP